MYLLEIDHAHNRIHLTLSEHFDEPQAKALLQELMERSAELELGFHVLCDCTTLEEFEHSARAHFCSVMDIFNECGVCKIIRIVSNPVQDFELTVMSYFHYNDSVSVIKCRNLQEALTHLQEGVHDEI